MDVEAMNEALRAVKALRSSVGNFFITLSQGVRSDHGEENKETKFILELQDLITEVNSYMRCVCNLLKVDV
jgi:mediator of RNA polymerase II transcription subunit 27